MNNKFREKDIVVHIATGKKYVILDAPNEDCKIESNNKTCYYYAEINNRQGWIRPKDEMEDGRFKKKKK